MQTSELPERERLRQKLADHIGPIGRRKRIGLDEYSVYSERSLLQLVVNHVAETIAREGLTVDVIGAMGPSGIPLAVSLVSHKSMTAQRWVYVSDPAVGTESRKEIPIKPPEFKGDDAFLKGKRVLLVDSVIKTGSTVYEAALKVRKEQASVVAAAVILDYVRFWDRQFADKVPSELGIPRHALFWYVPKGPPGPTSDWLEDPKPPVASTTGLSRQ